MKINKIITILSATLISVSCGYSFDLFNFGNKDRAQAEKYLGNRYSDDITYTKTKFANLGYWVDAHQLKSFFAFQKSCQRILNDNKPEYKNWIAVCNKTVSTDLITDHEARIFFESNFSPYEIIYNGSAQGLFTGYYEPIIKGSLTKTYAYNIPIYKTPKDLVKIPYKDDSYKYGMYKEDEFVPYYSRENISKNNYFTKDDVLAWVNSKVDRAFLQIQGSGRIKTDNGNDILLGYDSQNGHPYRPIGRYIIQNNYMDAKNMSMQGIKQWLSKNPSKMQDVLNSDPSFVFFRYIEANNAIGAQGIELTPEYSLAVDNQYYLYGIPVWLETDYYSDANRNKKGIDRLMIAQDTGGAIRGPIRGDFFWGHGKKAEFNAGHMKNYGNIWILLPNYSNI